MNSVENQLKIVVSHLNRLKRPVVARINPGLSREQIVDQITRVGLYPSNELVELYMICNGTVVKKGDLLDDVHFFPGFYWLQVEDAIASFESLRKDFRWNPTWLPIFSNGGGDFYAIVCNKADINFGGIIGFLVGESENPIEFVTLGDMFGWMVACFERNIFFVSDKILDADFGEAELLAESIRSARIEKAS